jgi:hypothetical protein
MKQITYILIFLCCLFAVSASSQENMIKTGFSNAFFGDFNLSYERLINEKSSLQVKVGYFNPMASFITSENWITPNEYTFVDDKGGFQTSFEYRFYLTQGKIMEGFYLAPFVRHFNQRVLYTDMIDGDKFNVDLRALNFGIGAQLGYQLIISDWFTLDFYFMGLSLDHYTGKFKYTLNQPRTGFDYNSITDNIDKTFEDYKFLSNNLTHNVKTTQDDVKVPFFFPGIRIGISAGIAF